MISCDDTVHSTVKQNGNESKEKLKDEEPTELLISEDMKPTTPISNTRKRKTLRKHRKIKASRLTKEIQATVAESFQSNSSSEYDDEYGIVVSNLPNDWSYIQIKKYIDNECGPVDEMEMIKSENLNCSIRLYFQNEQQCKKALEKLSGKEIDGTKIVAEIDVFKDVSDSEVAANVTETTIASGNKKPWRPDLDIWEIDPKGLYGLKPQYLKSLDIEPPIDKWVHVSNFRCDKSELRDVMELAGHVLLCSVFTVANRYAKIMYSHPLEAVQAVSMLNCQTFYGKPLMVTMDKCPADTVMLPKGLANVGLGLGKTGRPLRNIVRHYERYLNNQSSLVNPIIFDVDGKHVTNDVSNDSIKGEIKSENKEALTESQDVIEFQIMNIAELKTFVDENNEMELNQNSEEEPTNLKTESHNGSKSLTINLNQNMQKTTAPIVKLNNVQNSSHFQPLVGLTRPGSTNTAGPVLRSPCPVQKQVSPGPFGCFRPGQFGSISSGARPPGLDPFSRGPVSPVEPRLLGPRPFRATGPRPQPLMALNSSLAVGHRPMLRAGSTQIAGSSGTQIFPGSESVTVKLSNLPPSTTFPLLCEKLSHCGQVLSLQLTTPGCAVVTFSRPIHAEICFKKYNGVNAEGHVINVTFM